MTIGPDDTTSVTFSILSISPVQAGAIKGLADIEVIIDGVVVVIRGIQIRPEPNRTTITLPTYRAPDGQWKPAVALPNELMKAITDAIGLAGIEAGILKRIRA